MLYLLEKQIEYIRNSFNPKRPERYMLTALGNGQASNGSELKLQPGSHEELQEELLGAYDLNALGFDDL